MLLIENEEARTRFWQETFKQIDRSVGNINAMFREAIRSEREQVLREARRFFRTQEKALTPEGLRDFSNRLLEFLGVSFERQSGALRLILGGISRRSLARINAQVPTEVISMSPFLQERIDTLRFTAIRQLNETTRRNLLRVIAENAQKPETDALRMEQLIADKVYGGDLSHRSETLARTLTGNATAEAQQYAYEQSSQIQYKIWISSRDSRVRDSHRVLDGEIVPKGAHFSNGDLNPPRAFNCRCTSAGVSEAKRNELQEQIINSRSNAENERIEAVRQRMEERRSRV